MLQRAWLIVVAIALGLCGCNEPVRVGIEAARAAGQAPAPHMVTVATHPREPVQRVAAADPPKSGPEGVTAPPVPQPTRSGQIVGFLVQNDTGAALPARALRFGQVFVPGQVPANSGLLATSNGKPAPTQFDVKTSNRDGSVRFGVVTIIAPPLAPGASMPFMLSLAPPPAGMPVPLSRLASDNVTVDLNVRDGQQYHLNAGRLAAEAIAAGHVSLWRSGPVVTEARIDKPVVGSLHLVLDIAADAAGGLTTDVQLRNDYAMQPVGGMLYYDVTVSSNGKPILSQSNVRHLQYTDWHIVVHGDGLADPNIVHDPAYVVRTGAVLHYDVASGVDPLIINQEAKQLGGPGFGILGNAGLAMGMGMTGGRPDIAPETAADAAWLISQDPRAQAYAIAQADASGTIPWHYYDVAHGHDLSLDDYPKIWTDARGAYRGPGGGLTQQMWPFDSKANFIVAFSKCECFTLDWAHQPNTDYVPYLLTGSRYYLDMLIDQAAWNLVGFTPSPDRVAKGIIWTVGWGQTRGNAWAMRTLDDAAYIVPDKHPLHDYFHRMRDNNYHFIQEHLDEWTKDEGEAYGYFFAFVGKSGMQAPWQEDFLGVAIGQAATQGYEPAREVYKWAAHFLVNRFLSADRGFDPHDGVNYQIYISPPGFQDTDPKRFYKTWAEMGQADNNDKAIATHGHWTNFTFGQSQQEALADLATIINTVGYPGADKAYDWLKGAASVNDAFARRDVGFDITPAAKR